MGDWTHSQSPADLHTQTERVTDVMVMISSCKKERHLLDRDYKYESLRIYLYKLSQHSNGESLGRRLQM